MYVEPFIVGILTGGVVYPTSPLIVVGLVLVNVPPRTPNVPATPRDGVVAADAVVGPIRPNINTTANIIIQTLLNIFMYYFILITFSNFSLLFYYFLTTLHIIILCISQKLFRRSNLAAINVLYLL